MGNRNKKKGIMYIINSILRLCIIIYTIYKPNKQTQKLKKLTNEIHKTNKHKAIIYKQ